MEGSLTIRPQTARMRSAFEPRGVTPGPLDGPAGNLQSSLFFAAKIGFHRALELDDHRIPAAILRGVGDTRVPMLVNFGGFYAVALPAAAALAFGVGLGARGIWWGLAGGLVVVAVLLAARVRHRMSGPLARVRIDDHDEGFAG